VTCERKAVEMAPQTRYTLQRNTASKTKGLVLVNDSAIRSIIVAVSVKS